MASSEVERRGPAYSETGMVVPEGCSFEEWAQLGVTLGRLQRCSQWWIGDWVNFGERAFGEKYAQALESTGLAYQTVANYAWVASRIPVEARREVLSFQHHVLLAGKALSEGEREEWKDYAEAGGWSASDLRGELKRAGKIVGPARVWGGEELCERCGRSVRAREGE